MSLLKDYDRNVYLYGDYCENQKALKKSFPLFQDYLEFKKAEFSRQVKPEIEALRDKELLEQTVQLAGGDDYDGCFTDYGAIIYDLLYTELADRFLGPEE